MKAIFRFPVGSHHHTDTTVLLPLGMIVDFDTRVCANTKWRVTRTEYHPRRPGSNELCTIDLSYISTCQCKSCRGGDVGSA